MRAERFTAWVFMFVIFVFMVLAPLSLVLRQINKMTGAVKVIKPVVIEWSKLYPFDDEKPRADEGRESLYEYVKHRLEDYTSQYLIGYHKIVEGSKKYEDIVSWNMASVFDYNAVMKLKDGYLTTYRISVDVSPDAASVKEFSDFCAGKGIDFLYINFPAKVCISEDSDISGTLDFTNQNADRFLSLLKDSGVRCYDFRKTLHDDGMKHHEAFFVTDHHWKPETGLWAARHILRILKDDLGWNVKPEILSPEKFEYVVYPEWFLGSQGKKVTLVRTKPDNFTMIYPKYTVNLKYTIPSLNLSISGDFRVSYAMENVETKDYYNKDPFGAYNHARRDLIRIKNRSTNNNKKLLIIYDSLSNVVIPFVAIDVSYIEAVDLRQFTGSLKSLIETINPDAIIIEYLATMIGSISEKVYDFR